MGSTGQGFDERKGIRALTLNKHASSSQRSREVFSNGSLTDHTHLFYSHHSTFQGRWHLLRCESWEIKEKWVSNSRVVLCSSRLDQIPIFSSRSVPHMEPEQELDYLVFFDTPPATSLGSLTGSTDASRCRFPHGSDEISQSLQLPRRSIVSTDCRCLPSASHHRWMALLLPMGLLSTAFSYSTLERNDRIVHHS